MYKENSHTYKQDSGITGGRDHISNLGSVMERSRE